MIDRVEELLSMVAAEDEDDGQEEVPALKKPVVPAASPQEEGEAAGAGADDRPAAGPGADGRLAAELRTDGWPTSGAGTDGWPTAGAGTDGRLTAGTGRETQGPGQAAGQVLAEDGQALEEAPDGGLVWTVDGSPMLGAEAAVRRQAVAEALDQAAETLKAVRAEAAGPLKTARTEAAQAAAGRAAGYGGEPMAAAAAGQQAGAGLEKLYRQTVQAARPAAPALPAGPAVRTARAAEPGSAASLAVDELDRAVRRDSRRYDGGMSIF